MKEKIEDSALYDVPALASLLSIEERTVRALVGNGVLRGKKLAKKWYVLGSDIKSYFSGETAAKKE